MQFRGARQVRIDLGGEYAARVVALAVHDAINEFADGTRYHTYTDFDRTYELRRGRPDWRRPQVYLGVERRSYMDVEGFEIPVAMGWDDTIEQVQLDALEPDIPERNVDYPAHKELEAFCTVLDEKLLEWDDRDLPGR